MNRRRYYKKKRQSSRLSRGRFEYMRHPLSMIDPDELKQALVELAQSSADTFQGHRDAILAVFRDAFPPHIIATLAGWGLFARASNMGVASGSMIPDLQQHHIELLQALALSMDPTEWGTKPAKPPEIQTVLDAIQALATTFYHRRLQTSQESEDLQESTARALQEKLRLHTQIVRNWGYLPHVAAISSELYGAMDDSIKLVFGFGANDLIAVAQSLVTLIERRNSERLRILNRIFLERSIPRLIRQFFAKFPGAEGDPEALIKEVPDWATIEHVKFRLLSMADVVLVSNATFHPSEVSGETGLTESVVKAVLDILSHRQGALIGTETEHLFLSNPIWTKPFIVTGQHYFCVAPQVVFSFIHKIMRQLAEQAGVKEHLEKRRSTYLEEKVASLIAGSLPTTSIQTNIPWKDGNATYETDVFAQIDQTILIVEAKSHSLSQSGLRGAPDRVRRHVQELIVNPSVQSGRLEALIEAARDGDIRACEALAPFNTDWTNVQSVVRVSVTLDDFSILASSEIDLRKTGWIPEDMQLAPTLNLADFSVVLDLLGEPAFILHYLAERNEIQKAINIFADEMDFLGYYLETGFNVWQVEQSATHLSISGMSRNIDHYYMSTSAGVAVPKPAPKVRPFLKDILSLLQQRTPPGWVKLAIGLLRVGDYGGQAKIERHLTRLRANVRKNWRNPDHECSLIVVPPACRDMPVIFYIYPLKLAERRRETASVLASQALENSERPCCLVVGKMTEFWDEPYTFISLYYDNKLAEAV